MSRWKQVLRCADCGHRGWREVETDMFRPDPNLAGLLARARCSQCGGRNITGKQYDIGERHLDQLRVGGMRIGLVTFDNCAGRDEDVRAALAKYREKHGTDFVHPLDPEFGGE